MTGREILSNIVQRARERLWRGRNSSQDPSAGFKHLGFWLFCCCFFTHPELEFEGLRGAEVLHVGVAGA